MPRKILLEDIRAEVEREGWKLLSDEYKNLDTELIFECSEGHKIYSSWKKIRQKIECPICKDNYNKINCSKVISKEKDSKRILSIDQATKITGWSIFDNVKLIKYGLYETSFEEEAHRISEVKNWLINMINNWKPDLIQLEDIHYQRRFSDLKEPDDIVGVTTFKALAHLQGVLINTAYEKGIDYKIVSPSTWRAHCGIKGKSKADKKKNAQLKVKDLYDVTVSNDEADAICIGKYGADTFVKNQEMIEF